MNLIHRSHFSIQGIRELFFVFVNVTIYEILNHRLLGVWVYHVRCEIIVKQCHHPAETTPAVP